MILLHPLKLLNSIVISAFGSRRSKSQYSRQRRRHPVTRGATSSHPVPTASITRRPGRGEASDGAGNPRLGQEILGEHRLFLGGQRSRLDHQKQKRTNAARPLPRSEPVQNVDQVPQRETERRNGHGTQPEHSNLQYQLGARRVFGVFGL